MLCFTAIRAFGSSSLRSLVAETCADSRYFNDNIRDDYANGQLDVNVENVLAEMKELAIYGV